MKAAAKSKPYLSLTSLEINLGTRGMWISRVRIPGAEQWSRALKQHLEGSKRLMRSLLELMHKA